MGSARTTYRTQKGLGVKGMEGAVLTSYNGQIAEDENASFVFMPSVERPNLRAREWGHMHETWEAAKQEGYEMLERKIGTALIA